MRYDVAIVGGGPAGLSAALILGRATRHVIVLDSGRPRNRATRSIHGYLTRDGVSPCDFSAAARADLRPYKVELVEDTVTRAERETGGGFCLWTEGGLVVQARKLLFATGVRDALPVIEGIDQFYGRSIHHCPYCDAWEHRGKRLVSLGSGNGAVGLAMALRTWSETVLACTQGVCPDEQFLELARRNQIELIPERVCRFLGTNGSVEGLRLETGRELPCDAVFFHADQYQRSDLPVRLGCQVGHDNGIIVSDRQRTGVPGLFVAGDADREVQFVIVAAGQGATAAVAINRELQDEERGTPEAAGAAHIGK